jgi:hypothetical protein
MKLKRPNFNRLTAFSGAVILLFLFSAAPACKKTGTGTITVSVVDLLDTPVRGVSVTLASRLTAAEIKKTTSPKGTCMFFAVPAGNNYALKIEKKGYILKSWENVMVAAGKETLIRLSLPVDRKNIPGNWRLAGADTNTGPLKLSAGQKEAVRKLETLGYLSGYRAAPTSKNVTLYNKEKAYNGLNLYCSGHAPEAILIDMKGKELHRWRYDITRIPGKKYDSPLCLYWRRVHLMENGDLLAIFEGHLLIKIDKNSRLLWSYSGGAHHDLFIMPDGRIYVLTRKAVIDPEYNPTEPVLKDFIVLLSPGGKEIRRVSILKCLENSKYAHVLKRMPGSGDILHTNTLEVLNGKGKLSRHSPAFKKGNVLISILYLDLIAVVDMENESVVWAMEGMWKRQHQPTVLDNGRMLILDNQFPGTGTPGTGVVSRVLEFDPFTRDIYWEYRGTPDTPFYTGDCGSCRRLPNGNTLITETGSGRAFEVTPAKTVAWEFYNPKRAGGNNELIAALFEMIRLSPGYTSGWLR